MKTSNLSPRQLILTPFIYGLLTCIIALLIRQALLTEEMRYTSNWTSIFLLLVLSFGAFVYFKQLDASLTSARQLFKSSLAFGVAAGIAVGLFYYINVAIFDTDYLQKTLDVSYESWADKGYSKDAIANQAELTETFQHPLKWSLILALFYFILAAGLSFIIGCMTRKDIPSNVDMDKLKHA